MTRVPVVVVIGFLVTGSALIGQQSPSSAEAPAEVSADASGAEFAGELEKSSYALGYSLGKGLHTRKMELATEELIEGLRDGLAGQGGRLSDQEAVVITNQLQNAANRRLQAERQALITQNKATGEAFMAENKDRPGVVSLPSGLQYEVLVAADGPKPAVDDTVKVHYRTTTIDGTVVDSSYDRGAPAVLRPDRVVPAWKEALPMMSVGSTWRLFTPAELGFGANNGSSNIPPGATLIFDVELLSIEPRPETAETPAQE